ncbi:MAG: protein kinase [Planctomycetota bacterium]
MVERMLGRGAMGLVYLARRGAETVVLKVLAPALAHDAGARQRFLREWEALSRLHPHPNVVRVLDVRGDGPLPCAVIEHVPGEALDQTLLREGRLAPRRAAELTRDLARGLAAVHAHGLLHRDVKPANAIAPPGGAAKLIDFGLAKDLFRTGLTQPGQLLGTVLYMPPEVWEEEETDARSDVFSLGATLYHLLTGQPPFQGDDVDEVADAVLEGAYAPLRELAPEAPLDLDLVVRQALMTDPSLRYARMDELARDLDAVLAGGEARAPVLRLGRQRFALLPGEWFALGSAGDAAIPLPFPGVAPRHAELRREGGRFQLRDLQSPTGTQLEGQRLEPGRPVELRDGARLNLGGAVELLLSDPPGARGGAAASQQDVERARWPEPIPLLLAQDGDPRAFLCALERLRPDPWVEAASERALTQLLGPEAARAARARQGPPLGGPDEVARRLGVMTQADVQGDPLDWLAWWHQVRLSAPAQVGAAGGRPGRLLSSSGQEVALEGEGVLLVGRDERCQVRLAAPAPRLAATLLRLHERWMVLDAGQGATQLRGQPCRRDFFDPGAELACGALRLRLETPLPSFAPNAEGLIEVEPLAFEALWVAGHPSLASAALGLVVPRAAELQRATAQLFPGAPDAARAFHAKLQARAAERARQAAALLGRLLGPGDPASWSAALPARRAALGPQVGARGGLLC